MKLIFDNSITITMVLVVLGAYDGDATDVAKSRRMGGDSKSGSKSASESGHCPNDLCPPITQAYCSSLKECYWPGMRHGAVGDGHCDTDGCYNTKICGYDGGDCCPETCVSTDHWTCGEFGYDCKAAPPEPEECPCKKIRIYRFCADGTLDNAIEGSTLGLKLNADAHGEITDVKSGMCYQVDEPYEEIPADMIFKSLTVGIAPEGADGFLGVAVSSAEWFNPTCDPYEVRIARDYKGEKTRNVCINKGGEIYKDYLEYESRAKNHGWYWDYTASDYDGVKYRDRICLQRKNRCRPRGHPRCCDQWAPAQFLEEDETTISKGAYGGYNWEKTEGYSFGWSGYLNKNSCESWVDPPNSYIWLIEVLPLRPCHETD